MSEQLYVVRATNPHRRRPRVFVAYETKGGLVQTWVLVGGIMPSGIKSMWTAAEAVEISICRMGLSDRWVVEVVPCG